MDHSIYSLLGCQSVESFQASLERTSPPYTGGKYSVLFEGDIIKKIDLLRTVPDLYKIARKCIIVNTSDSNEALYCFCLGITLTDKFKKWDWIHHVCTSKMHWVDGNFHIEKESEIYDDVVKFRHKAKIEAEKKLKDVIIPDLGNIIVGFL